MKIPFDDGLKYLILTLVFIAIALLFNQGQATPRPPHVPPHEVEPPVALFFAVAGLGCGMLGVIKIIREARAK